MARTLDLGLGGGGMGVSGLGNWDRRMRDGVERGATYEPVLNSTVILCVV